MRFMPRPARLLLLTAALALPASAALADKPTKATEAQPAKDNAPAQKQPEKIDQALEHIRLLEQLLRDAGADVPSRPGALAEPGTPPQKQKPILPLAYERGPLGPLARVINDRSDKADVAVYRVRVLQSKGDKQKKQEAEKILAELQAWADVIATKAERLEKTDPVSAYMLAQDTLAIVGRDKIGLRLRAMIKRMKSDRKAWKHIESMADYRRAMKLADEVGLTGDWKKIDFSNGRVRDNIKQVTGRLELITKKAPSTQAGKQASAHLEDWAKREAQAKANLPAWRYTWNVGLIKIGKETERVVLNIGSSGDFLVKQEEKIVYDPRRVEMFGTFQNTSDKSYRYSFVVGVSSKAGLGIPWSPTSAGTSGFATVQTPRLKPGEVYNWSVTVTVRNVEDLRRGGMTDVKAWEPSPSRAKQ